MPPKGLPKRPGKELKHIKPADDKPIFKPKQPGNAPKPLSNLCKVAEQYPNYAFLTHQTSLDNLKTIIEKRYLLPPRHFKTPAEIKQDIEIRNHENVNHMGALEGVFMTLVRKSDFDRKNPIFWFNKTDRDQVILVFPLTLLERNDYYLNLRDQFGDINHQTFSKQTLITKKGVKTYKFEERSGEVKDIVPTNKIKIFPQNPKLDKLLRSPEHVPGLPLGFNEIMFWNPVHLSMCIEIWLHPGGTFGYNTKATTIINESSILKTRPIIAGTNFYKDIENSKDRLLGCEDDELIEKMKTLRAPFCRSGIFTGYNSHLYTPSKNIIWRDKHLYLLQNIAYNCGMKEDIIKRIRNPDILTWYIKLIEDEYLYFFLDMKKKGIPNEDMDNEFISLFMRDRETIKHPPFSTSLLKGKTEIESINQRSPFYGIVQIIIDQMEKELEMALSGKHLSDTENEEMILDVFYKIRDKYRQFLDMVNIVYNSDKFEQKDFPLLLDVFITLECLYEPEAQKAQEQLMDVINSLLRYRLTEAELDEIMNKTGITEQDVFDEFINRAGINILKKELGENAVKYKLFRQQGEKLITNVDRILNNVNKACKIRKVLTDPRQQRYFPQGK